MSTFIIESKLGYIHNPRTGGTWMTKIAKPIGLLDLDFSFGKHVDYVQSGMTVPAYSGIRHPVSWWKSVYFNRTTFHNKKGKIILPLPKFVDISPQYSVLDEMIATGDNINEWLEHVLENNATNLWYAPYENENIQDYIRLEHLLDDLAALFTKYEITYNQANLIRQKEKIINRNDMPQGKGKIIGEFNMSLVSKTITDEIIRREKDAIDKFRV